MKKEIFRTTIGGQALIEGVMMRGPDKIAMSVRLPDGSIDTESWDPPERKWYNKAPFIRGIFNFISSMKTGYKCLMMSAEKSGFDEIEEEPSKLEKALGDKFMGVVVAISGVLGMVIGVLLFSAMPAYVTSKLSSFFNIGWTKNLIEGIIRIGIFVGYIAIVGQMSDIKRVFQYHGAEHKSISCYEQGLELTPENAKTCTRLHPRCGTSFILISIVVSVIVSSFITWDVLILRVLLKMLFLPLIIGISYELIQWAGKSNSLLSKIVSRPGMWLQHLTTKEPDEAQLEIAITSLKAVIPADKDSDKF